MIKYPIIAVLGNRGDGKTLTLTTLGKQYESQGINVFANYKLIDTNYKQITFEKIAEFPSWLKDGVILMDEAHIGLDSYAFFNKRVKDITKFVTQLRKRRLVLYYTTQVFKTVALRLRQQTDYIVDCRKTDIEGIVELFVFDYREPDGLGGFELINRFKLDGRDYFKYYDTNEIIELEDE